MAREKPEIKIVEKGPLIKKTESTAIRISIISINEEERIDIREFYRTKDSKEWKPTAKGFTLPLDLATKATIRFRRFVKEQVE